MSCIHDFSAVHLFSIYYPKHSVFTAIMLQSRWHDGTHSFRVPGVILSSGYCLCGVSPIRPMSLWVSFLFSGFLSKHVVVGLAPRNHSWVWMCVCAYNALAFMVSLCLLQCSKVRPPQTWPGTWPGENSLYNLNIEKVSWHPRYTSTVLGFKWFNKFLLDILVNLDHIVTVHFWYWCKLYAYTANRVFKGILDKMYVLHRVFLLSDNAWQLTTFPQWCRYGNFPSTCLIAWDRGGIITNTLIGWKKQWPSNLKGTGTRFDWTIRIKSTKWYILLLLYTQIIKYCLYCLLLCIVYILKRIKHFEKSNTAFSMKNFYWSPRKKLSVTTA